MRDAILLFCTDTARTYLNHFPLKPRPHCGEGRALLLGNPLLLSNGSVQCFRAPDFGLQLVELCPS